MMRSDFIPPDLIESSCTCAGVFLVDDDLNVLLVESKRKNYQYSFPKGKRNRGEDTMTAAKRELLEETGIHPSDYDIIPGERFIEYRIKTVPGQERDTNFSKPDPFNENSIPHIVYYVATLNKKVTLCPIDTKEVVSAEWFSPDEIYKMKRTFYLQRRQIVTRAIKSLKTRKDRSMVYSRPFASVESQRRLY